MGKRDNPLMKEDIELQKALDALPDGTTIVLPNGWFRLIGQCQMKSHQILQGSSETFLVGNANY